MSLTKKLISRKFLAYTAGITLTLLAMEIAIPRYLYSRMEREFLSKQQYAKMQQEGTLVGEKLIINYVQGELKDTNDLASRIFYHYWREACKMYLEKH